MSDTMANGTTTTDYTTPWVIEWRGSRLASDEVTVAQFSLAVMLAHDTWELDPRASPSNLVAWAIVAVCSDTGRDVDDVQAELGAAPMVELLRALTVG
jgi:hypothetical protein